MIELAPSLLALACGGGAGLNVEKITSPKLSIDRALTDYGYCADIVRSTCKAAHGGFLFGTYNKAAAACTFTQLPKVCGQPAADAAG